MHVCSEQVSTQEAMSCPAFSLKGAVTVSTPTFRLKRPGSLKMCQQRCEKRRKEILLVRWGEGKGDDTRGRGGKRGGEREIQTKSERERQSCGLNSGQLFKACACSWVGAALIKYAVSEQATDTREGGTHRLTGEKQHHFQEPKQKQKKILNINTGQIIDENWVCVCLPSV